MLALGACAATRPSAPSVIGLPPAGKDLSQVQQEDASCRAYASQQFGASAGSSYALQQRYDIAYAQCMYSKGDTVSPAALVTGVSYAGYRPYYGPLFGGAIIGFGGGCCRGHHQMHRAWGGQRSNGGIARSGGWHGAGSRS
jgi:hypothetical protein